MGAGCLSEDTGPGCESYKFSPASVLLRSPGANHSLCLCLQMWYGDDGMDFLERHFVDWWKEKLPSSERLFLHHMEHCRAGREERCLAFPATFPLLIGLQGREEQVSEYWCKAMGVLQPVISLAWMTEGQQELHLVLYHFVCILGRKHLVRVAMALLKGCQNAWVLQWDQIENNLGFFPLFCLLSGRDKKCYFNFFLLCICC